MGFFVLIYVFEVSLGFISLFLSVLVSYFKDGEGCIVYRKDLLVFVNDYNMVDVILGILSGLVSRDDLWCIS